MADLSPYVEANILLHVQEDEDDETARALLREMLPGELRRLYQSLQATQALILDEWKRRRNE